ncbi:MAG: RsmB/NOP family class I SAM-dependent RNA methyltransferase [Victivallales bacterium]|nr:RsmB/NOP family class I SAM-dependent RNA methyltransferase [Victivallales bacterium]
MNGSVRTAEKILTAAVAGITAREQENVGLDDFLDRRFRVDGSGRAAVTHLLFTYYRRKAALDRLLRELAPGAKRELQPLLSAVMTQLYFMTGISSASAVNVAVSYARQRFGSRPAGYVNAILRRAAAVDFGAWEEKQPHGELLPAAADLRRNWRNQLPAEELSRLELLLREPPPFTFRARRELTAAEVEELHAVPLTLPSWSGAFRFYRSDRPAAVLASGLTGQGAIYIQDPATAAAPGLAAVLPGGAAILDLCAAPGGKSLMLAERFPTCRLTAADVSTRRQELTRENFRHAGYDFPVVIADALQPPFAPASFDLVLLDVPCTNSGVGRHRPDALWAYTAAKAAELTALQYGMLTAAARLVMAGGQLIYSTCSIEKQEDEKQVRRFLSAHTSFRLEHEVKLLPAPEFDGAYAACLRRVQ